MKNLSFFDFYFSLQFYNSASTESYSREADAVKGSSIFYFNDDDISLLFDTCRIDFRPNLNRNKKKKKLRIKKYPRSRTS